MNFISASGQNWFASWMQVIIPLLAKSNQVIFVVSFTDIDRSGG